MANNATGTDADSPIYLELFARYADELSAAIANRISALEDFEDVNRVALAYSLGQPAVVPVTIAVARNEEIVDASEDPDEAEMNWNPAEFGQFGDEELAIDRTAPADEINALLEDSIGNEEVESHFREMLDAAALKATLTLRTQLPASTVFVYATDDELVDIKPHVDAIRAAVSDIDEVMPEWF